MLSMPQQSQAASMAIGFNTWFNKWMMPWEEMDQYYVQTDYDVDPGLLFGPMISFQITPQWSISSLFMMGAYENFLPIFEASYQIWRYDSDTTLSYAFKPYFRMYLGFKYLRYNWEYEDDYIFSDNYEKMWIVSDSFAPGMGFIFVVPLIKNLNLTFILGGLFTFSEIEQKYESLNSDSGDDVYTEFSGTTLMNEVVLNSKLSFSYTIEIIHLILALGFRYQVFFFFYNNDWKLDYSGRVDHLYGIDFSVTFYFDL